MFGELQGAAAPCELGPKDLWKGRQVLGGLMSSKPLSADTGAVLWEGEWPSVT